MMKQHKWFKACTVKTEKGPNKVNPLAKKVLQ